MNIPSAADVENNDTNKEEIEHVEAILAFFIDEAPGSFRMPSRFILNSSSGSASNRRRYHGIL